LPKGLGMPHRHGPATKQVDASARSSGPDVDVATREPERAARFEDADEPPARGRRRVRASRRGNESARPQPSRPARSRPTSGGSAGGRTVLSSTTQRIGGHGRGRLRPRDGARSRPSPRSGRARASGNMHRPSWVPQARSPTSACRATSRALGACSLSGSPIDHATARCNSRPADPARPRAAGWPSPGPVRGSPGPGPAGLRRPRARQPRTSAASPAPPSRGSAQSRRRPGRAA
jgi:hypothetical protein